MRGWKNRVHVHWKYDLLYIGGFTLLSLPYAFSNAHFFTTHGLSTEWYELYTQPIIGMLELDIFTIILDAMLVLISVFIFNYGFRVFEWNDKSFCMKSMFQRRCYRWDQVEEVVFDYRITAGRKLFILTDDGNFYIGLYHPVMERIFRETLPDRCRTSDYENQMDELAYWRARRKNSGVKMMFFQP